MPYAHEVNHIKLVGLQDRRRKLTDEQKAEIIRLREDGWSLMKLAKEFDVSKKSILLIVNPESKAKIYQRPLEGMPADKGGTQRSR